MAITKPVVRTAWAASATSADLLDPGAAFVSQGWPLSATPPARQYWNFVLNYCMNGVRYFSRRGIADYDPVETYQLNDTVHGDDDQIYRSLIANNTNNTPSTSPGSWGALKNYVTIASLATTLAGYVTTAALAAYVTGTQLTAALASYVTNSSLGTTLAGYVTNAQLGTALGGFGSGRLPAGTYRNAYSSGIVTIQSGGAPSGGSDGDMFLIY